MKTFKREKAFRIAAAAFLGLALSGCGNIGENTEAGPRAPAGGSADAPAGPADQSSALSLSLMNLMPVPGQHYEGWVIIGGRPVSTGRFNVDANGAVFAVDASGATGGQVGSGNNAGFDFAGDINAVTDFVLTVEPNNDTDPAPSMHRLAAGAFQGNTANARSTNMRALGADLGTASGSFILATPTNGPTTANQGIWFLMMKGGGGEGQSLMLPRLGAGWTYEGWIVNNQTNQVVSTGRFKSGKGFDSDQAGPGAGPMANMCPAFPGQDFINPPLVINDGIHSVVVTVEPDPESNPAPFPLRALTAPVAAGAAVMQNIALQPIGNGALPSVTATLRR